MKTFYLQTFSLVKYNLVLFFPFLLFLLIMGLVLIPLGSAWGSLSLFYIFFILITLMAVFLSGWLNMFKKCAYSTAEREWRKSLKGGFAGLEGFYVIHSWICRRWDLNPQGLCPHDPEPCVYTNFTTSAYLSVLNITITDIKCKYSRIKK